jgi:small subunit ribosomal protein S9
MSERATYNGTGKRKTSVARVILRPGDGTTWFNGRTIEQYFPRATHRELALAPLKVAGVEGTFDVRVRVHGGGPSGQAGAVRHGIARPVCTRPARHRSSPSVSWPAATSALTGSAASSGKT